MVKSPLNQNGRIISAPYGLSFLRGKRVGKVLQVIHDVALDNPQDFACEVASRICDPKASVRRDVLYEAFDLDELSLDHELFSFGPALQAMGRYGKVRVEVLFPPSLPPIVKLLKNGVVVMVLVQEGKLRRKVLNDVIRVVNSSSQGRLLKLRVGTAIWKQLLRND
ncbi:hypothetical protein DRO59_03365 [Candidatus Bathyarchaeota archaeon]|nr:MAG: hypothetical protein DRO59_03365 [Candidatus Bathyarchaeota archaeon]